MVEKEEKDSQGKMCREAGKPADDRGVIRADCQRLLPVGKEAKHLVVWMNQRQRMLVSK